MRLFLMSILAVCVAALALGGHLVPAGIVLANACWLRWFLAEESETEEVS